MADTRIFITPVSVRKGCNAIRDWEEQAIRGATGQQIMWDAPGRGRQPRVGDYFVFWFYERHIIVHRITAVHSPSHRLASWATNIGQQDRDVVYLDSECSRLTWDIFLAAGGHRRCMGTICAGDHKTTTLLPAIESKIQEVVVSPDSTALVSAPAVAPNQFAPPAPEPTSAELIVRRHEWLVLNAARIGAHAHQASKRRHYRIDGKGLIREMEAIVAHFADLEAQIAVKLAEEARALVELPDFLESRRGVLCRSDALGMKRGLGLTDDQVDALTMFCDEG
jgi:hypothetical protein